MVNTNVRTLKIFEFDRALSYISEIIEIERKINQLRNQHASLDRDFHDWTYEEFCTKEEEIVVNEIISEIKTKLQDIGREISELEKYTEALKSLVTKIMEAVMENDDEGLLLKKDEIRQDMLEEYVYLLCEIKINDDEEIDIKDVFDKVADFVILLAKIYGEDVTDLVSDILDEDIGDFEFYFG